MVDRADLVRFFLKWKDWALVLFADGSLIIG